MTLEKAKQIITEIAAARRKWGKHANPPYKLDIIMDALVAIGPALEASGGPSPEEVTKLRRQLAACQNREKGRKGHGDGDKSLADLGAE